MDDWGVNNFCENGKNNNNKQQTSSHDVKNECRPKHLKSKTLEVGFSFKNTLDFRNLDNLINEFDLVCSKNLWNFEISVYV